MSDSRKDVLDKIIGPGIVAVIRARTAEQVKAAVRALVEGGVTAIEITFTVPNAIQMIKETGAEYGDQVLLGAGTVTTPADAAAAIAAGARYIVSPNTNIEIVHLCHGEKVTVVPGAMTPTEVVTAVQAGADMVKIFPAEILGPRFIKALRGPLPDIRLMPTGGVTVDNVAEWFAAGATAVAAGGSLVCKDALESGNYAQITENAKRFVKAIKDCRSA